MSRFKLCENWIIIKDFPNYAVSDTGKIKRVKSGRGTKAGLILKSRKNSWGYLYVILRKNNKNYSKVIHKLVLENFVGIDPNKTYPNHKDGIKSNNKLDNLEWMTPSENIQHAYKTKLKRKLYGVKNGNSKLKEDDVVRIKSYLKNDIHQDQIAKMFNVSRSTIYFINTGKIWKHVI